VVVDFAVVNDPQIARFIGHGLLTGGQIHDAQAAMSELGPRIAIEAMIVRPAMRDRAGHIRDDLGGNLNGFCLD
jgi:hypothetical protein